MDNPAMTPLIPANLQNKKEVLFGNMPEIYHFHKRYLTATKNVPSDNTYIILCLHFLTSPSTLWFLFLFCFFRTFLRELEQYTDCPELVGRCFLERVS